MKPYATRISTPIGRLAAPLDPGFARRIQPCRTNADLFRLVDQGGMIDPDAFNEILVRGLYSEYEVWQGRNIRTG